MQTNTSWTLLTFYSFVDVQDPEREVRDHKQFCVDIGLQWRIYIGEEGISATVSGNTGQILAYKLYLAQHPLFCNIPDIDEKAMPVDGHCFDKMIVKYRKEIVALGKVVTQEMVQRAHQEVSIDEFKKMMDEEADNVAILDMRNDYEYQLGHFKDALPAGTVTFKEVHTLIQKYKEKLGDKKVVMYCTGGIRCEKLSALLQEEWMENVYALNGGVVKYVNKYNDGNRHGNLYTFDGRVSTPIGDETTHVTVGSCIYTDEPTDECENCRYSPCNARILCTTKQYRKHFGFCSQSCAEQAQKDLLVKNIDWDPVDYKALRGVIKQDPTQKEAIVTSTAAHIRKKLLHVTFRHQQPQKEQPIMHW